MPVTTSSATTALNWPNMFDVARNQVGVIEGDTAVVKRVRLLLLTDPTEVHMNPSQGVGLKRYLWQYNTENVKAIIKDRIVEQLRLHEPACVPDETQFADGLVFTGGNDPNQFTQEFNQLKMTVAVRTIYGDQVKITINGDELYDTQWHQ